MIIDNHFHVLTFKLVDSRPLIVRYSGLAIRRTLAAAAAHEHPEKTMVLYRSRTAATSITITHRA